MRYQSDWAKTHESEYYTLLAHQDYGCAICGIQNKPLMVDHDHRTREIRGLLCNPCNIWLGHHIDKYSAEYLMAAMSYLIHPPGGWLDVPNP